MENIGQLIKQISNKLINDLNKNLKKYDLTVSQLNVLVELNELKKPVCQKDLATTLKVKHTSLIDVLKILERKELIIKAQAIDNAKLSMIELTDKGIYTISSLDVGKDKTEEIIASTLGFESVKDMLIRFNDVLNKLEEGIK